MQNSQNKGHAKISESTVMQQMHSLGAQKVQWAQAPLRGPKYSCSRCQETAQPIDRRPQEEVQVVSDKLAVVASFCYLGDMLFAAGDN